jgi:hypothetical protein
MAVENSLDEVIANIKGFNDSAVLAKKLEEVSENLESNTAASVLGEVSSIIKEQGNMSVAELKSTRADLQLLKDKVRESDRVSERDRENILSLIANQEAIIAENTTLSKKAAEFISENVKDKIPDIAGIAAGVVAESPALALGVKFVGDKIQEAREKRKKEREEREARLQRIAEQEAIQDEEMELLRSSITAQETLAKLNMTAEEAQESAKKNNISYEEYINQLKDGLILDSKRKKAEADLAEKQSKQISDIREKFGVVADKDDDNKPPTPPSTPSSPVSIPVTEPTVVSDSDSGEISSQDTNKFAQRLEGIESQLTDGTPYLQSIRDFMEYMANPDTVDTNDIENQRENRRIQQNSLKLQDDIVDELRAQTDLLKNISREAGEDGEGGGGLLGGLAGALGLGDMLGGNRRGRNRRTSRSRGPRRGGRFGKLRGMFSGAFGKLKGLGGLLGKGGLIAGITGGLLAAGGGLLSNIKGAGSAAIDGLKGFVSNAADNIKSFGAKALDSIKSVGSSILDSGKALLKLGQDAVAKGTKVLAETAGIVVKNADSVTKPVANLTESATKNMDNAAGALTKPVTNAVDSMPKPTVMTDTLDTITGAKPDAPNVSKLPDAPKPPSPVTKPPAPKRPPPPPSKLGSVGSAVGDALKAPIVKVQATAGKVVAKAVPKKLAQSILARKAAKLATKAVPVLGALAGGWFALSNLFKGDFVGAAAEAGGILAPSLIGLPIDAGIMARETYNEIYGTEENPFPLEGDLISQPEVAAQRMGELKDMAFEAVGLGGETAAEQDAETLNNQVSGNTSTDAVTPSGQTPSSTAMNTAILNDDPDFAMSTPPSTPTGSSSSITPSGSGQSSNLNDWSKDGVISGSDATVAQKQQVATFMNDSQMNNATRNTGNNVTSVVSSPVTNASTTNVTNVQMPHVRNPEPSQAMVRTGLGAF